jgi:hypothetical protein
MDPSDILDEIVGAAASGAGNYVRDGAYLHTIKKFYVKKGHKGTSVILEMTVDEARKTEPDTEPNPVGSSVSIVNNLTKQDSASGNVKAIVLAVLGFEESQVDPVALKKATGEALGPNQPFRGVRVRNNTVRRYYDERGKEVPKTFSNLEHVPGQTPEMITARRAELDGGAVAPAPAPVETAPPPAPTIPAPAGGSLLASIGVK